MQSSVSWYQPIEVKHNVLTSREMQWSDKGPQTKSLGLLHEAIYYFFFFSRKKKIKEFY